MSEEIPVKEIAELLDNVTEKLPKLLNGVFDTLYSADSGKKMGQAVGGFYKELIESGIPAEDALKMTKDYMLSIKDLANSFSEKR
ncbi:MAG: hypothetical protein GX059_03335 [Clostridiales bacterium]|jgi:flavodoxin|nr:hypothetical protein [Clostridiales bacterium]